MKELDGTTEPIARMNVEWKLEKAEYAGFNLPTFGKIAVCQLCRERQPLWKSRDGLNLTCLDQCHGVRSDGTSSSQGWRKIIVMRHSKNYPWNSMNEFTSVFSTNLLCVGLPRNSFSRKRAFVDRKQVPRFAQGQPMGYFQMKEFHRETMRDYITTYNNYILVNPWNAYALSGLAGCKCSHFRLAVSCLLRGNSHATMVQRG